MKHALLLLALLAVLPSALIGAEHVWVEGERPAAADFDWHAAGAKKSGLLSGAKWLMPRKRIDLPEKGYTVAYDMTVPKSGRYDLWLRVGFEWIRANVAWRFDGGAWTTVGIAARLDAKERKKVAGLAKPDLERRSTDVMALDTWNEVAWWPVGAQELTQGRRRLQLRFLRNHRDDPMVALDAILLVQGKWTPSGTLRPGATYGGDRDKEAAQTVYALPAASDATRRSEVTLTGLWQVARYDDPDMNVDTYEPVRRLPAPEAYDLKWLGVKVPQSLWQVPEMVFGHRAIYRTHVDIPASHAGRGFTLHFSGTSWIVSVFVNGKLAGTHQGVWIPWDLDISEHVKPGRVNELAVAVKGSYYTFDPQWHQGDLNSKRNLPRSHIRWARWVAPIYPSTKGDGDGVDYGIVNPVTLISTGPTYTEDVFIKPSVQRKELVTDVTVHNTLGKARQLQVLCEAVHDASGETEQRFGPVPVTVGARASASVTVRGRWANPKLWWPLPQPHLYRLRTRILDGGTTVDTHEELFGFREVTWKGPALFINGVRRNFWCWVDVKKRPQTADEYEKTWRAEGNRCLRFSQNRKLARHLKSREERLAYYDRKGMPGRLCSMIDGMFINYNLIDRKGTKKKAVPNKRVWANFRRHVAQMTKAYRNHPSVIFYQIENELIYINGMNVYKRDLPVLEREMLEVYRAGKANDPTRPYTVGGAGDLSQAEGLAGPEQALEINSPHYPAGNEDWYPENAYTIEKYSSKIRRWPWTRKKPWVVGESGHGATLEVGSCIAGPIAFRSQEQAERGKARYARMLYGGYRWAGVAGWFPWMNMSSYEDGRKIFSDLCVIPRKQTHRLYGGRENALLFKVMNDTFSRAPVTFEWTYTLNGREVAGHKEALKIEPGYGVERTVVIAPPKVRARGEGVLQLKASQAGAPDYIDERLVPTLPVLEQVVVKVAVSLLDRSGRIGPVLERLGVQHRQLAVAADAKDGRGLLIVGPDTLTPSEAWGRDLLAFAARGGRVIVLEQDNPVGGGNLPVRVKLAGNSGGYAHPQALGSALYRDLGKDDLIDWAGDFPTFKRVYRKPAQGVRSLAECGAKLPDSPLLEFAVGHGAIVLCQLRVGAKLGVEPAADVLFRNLLTCYADHSAATGRAAVYAPADKRLAEKLLATGALQEPVPDIRSALDPARYRVAIIDASERNVRALLDMTSLVDSFARAGGWVMLCGVRPQSIDGVNHLVGAKHMLRPFRIEREHLLDTDTPLAATLGDADVMLYDAEWIARWQGSRWVSGETFRYVLDSDDAAPFTYPPGARHEPYRYRPLRNDKDPYNFVNGLMNLDFWKYIRQIWIDDDGPKPLVFTLRRPETLREIRIWNNANYSTIENLDIIFDGDESSAVRMTLPDAAEMAVAKFPEARTAAKTITLQIRSWREKDTGHKSAHRLLGIDNVAFIRARRPSGAKVLDRAGGLVAFPRGTGGIFLNQIRWMEEEAVASNAAKKLRLAGTLLRNMGVGMRTAQVAVPGVNVRFTTLDLTDHCTQFMTSRQGRTGWFGKKDQDLTKLPLGQNHFADVLYHVVDYRTAPVPDCIVLGGLRDAPKGLKE